MRPVPRDSRNTRIAWALAVSVTMSVAPVGSAGASPASQSHNFSAISGLEIPGEYPGTRGDPATTSLRQLGRIWIERLGVATNIFWGVEDPQFKKGLGYWPGTGLPGQIGNMVVGGHRVSGPRPFYYIDRLKIGDPILINYKGKRYTYKVVKKQIVKPNDTWILNQNVRRPTLTMFACHPRGSYKQRYVVTAVLRK